MPPHTGSNSDLSATTEEGAAIPAGTRWEERLKAGASILAPTTLAVGILYYFGYVTTRHWYAYFGINVDAAHLSQPDFLLRSVAALYLPAALIMAVGCGVQLGRSGLRRLAATANRRTLLATAMALWLVGTVAAGRGTLGVLMPAMSAAEFPATSAACLGLGALLLAAATYLTGRRRARPGTSPARWYWYPAVGVALLSLLWATNSIAAAYGLGQAISWAEKLPRAPTVIVDTTEQLYLPNIEPRLLAQEKDQKFRYRYRGLCLLTASGGHLFLIPRTWSAGSGIVVEVPDDGSVRVLFTTGDGWLAGD